MSLRVILAAACCAVWAVSCFGQLTTGVTIATPAQTTADDPVRAQMVAPEGQPVPNNETYLLDSPRSARGDFNGDGHPDLIWQNDSTRQVVTWYLGGALGYTLLGDNWLASNGPLGWSVTGLSDLDGDGHPDLIWQHDSTRMVAVWYLGGWQGNWYLGSGLVTSGAVGWTAIPR